MSKRRVIYGTLKTEDSEVLIKDELTLLIAERMLEVVRRHVMEDNPVEEGVLHRLAKKGFKGIVSKVKEH